MQQDSMARQIALTGYGTRYLRGEAALDEWCNHGVFHAARLLFRALDGALLADEFTFWLGRMKEAGARRLSLHHASEIDADFSVPAALAFSRYVVVVHYAGHYEAWAVGEEEVAWRGEPLAPDPYPRGYWCGQVDTYWCCGKTAGVLAVPDTDWKQLAATIAADLKIAVPSSKVPAGPRFAPHREHVAALPLFPSTDVAALAHRVLATLEHERATFANDTHPQNDNNRFHHLDEQGAAELEAWGRRLDSWITEVQLRCANETRGVSRATWGKGQQAERPVAHEVPAPVRAGEEVGAFRTPRDNWLRRIAFAVTLGVLSALVLGAGRVVAAFPWAALAIGLLWTLYVRRSD